MCSAPNFVLCATALQSFIAIRQQQPLLRGESGPFERAEGHDHEQLRQGQRVYAFKQRRRRSSRRLWGKWKSEDPRLMATVPRQRSQDCRSSQLHFGYANNKTRVGASKQLAGKSTMTELELVAWFCLSLFARY